MYNMAPYKGQSRILQRSRARAAQAHALLVEAMQIADDGRNDTYVDSEGKQRVGYDNIRRSELRVRYRQWLLRKAGAHIYGDRAATLHI